MNTPRSTDDLRDELQLQAHETEAWDVPPLVTPARRAVTWRAGGAVLVSAALVATLLLVPSWFSRTDEAGPASNRPDPVLGGPPRFGLVEWMAGSQCEAASVECAAPETVQAGDRTLIRTDVLEVDEVGRQGEGLARGTERLDLPGPTGWVMVGLTRGGRAELGAMVVGGGYSVTSDGPALFSVGGGPRRQVPVTISARGARSPGAQLFVATFVPVGNQPRADWETTLQTVADCDEVDQGCVAPSSVVLDGIDLVRGEDGAQGAGDLQGRFDRPQPGAWFMLGTPEPDDGGPLEISVGGADPVTVPVDRPVLVRVPDGAPASYEIRTADGRRLPLFLWVYRLGES